MFRPDLRRHPILLRLQRRTGPVLWRPVHAWRPLWRLSSRGPSRPIRLQLHQGWRARLWPGRRLSGGDNLLDCLGRVHLVDLLPTFTSHSGTSRLHPHGPIDLRPMLRRYLRRSLPGPKQLWRMRRGLLHGNLHERWLSPGQPDERLQSELSLELSLLWRRVHRRVEPERRAALLPGRGRNDWNLLRRGSLRSSDRRRPELRQLRQRLRARPVLCRRFVHRAAKLRAGPAIPVLRSRRRPRFRLLPGPWVHRHLRRPEQLRRLRSHLPAGPILCRRFVQLTHAAATACSTAGPSLPSGAGRTGCASRSPRPC